jgi:hypothetical protein
MNPIQQMLDFGAIGLKNWRELGCATVRHWLPGYLDGAMPDGRSGAKLRMRMARHLDHCASCRAELESYQSLARIMVSVSTVGEPPDELGVAIRIALARSRETAGFEAFLERSSRRLDLFIDNVISPLLVPVAGGAFVALLVFAFVFPLLGGGMLHHSSTSMNDLPTSLMQPARLQTLAGFPLPGLLDTGTREVQGLLVEATVNSDGQAISYRIIGSPVDAGTQRQLDRVVLFSRFRPQLSFGKPTSTGRVVLGFSRIEVRG